MAGGGVSGRPQRDAGCAGRSDRACPEQPRPESGPGAGLEGASGATPCRAGMPTPSPQITGGSQSARGGRCPTRVLLKSCVIAPVTPQPVYGISSLPPDAERLWMARRAHGSMEHTVPWARDVLVREADARLQGLKGADHFAILRRFGLNLVTHHPPKLRLPPKPFKAALDGTFLAQLLQDVSGVCPGWGNSPLCFAWQSVIGL
jgi:hypothetical protein